MATFALLAWVIVLVLIAIGVIVNVVLYVKGAFKRRLVGRERLESVVLSRETTESENDYYMSLGATGRPMDNYSLRMLRMLIFSMVVVALFFAGLFVLAFAR